MESILAGIGGGAVVLALVVMTVRLSMRSMEPSDEELMDRKRRQRASHWLEKGGEQ